MTDETNAAPAGDSLSILDTYDNDFTPQTAAAAEPEEREEPQEEAPVAEDEAPAPEAEEESAPEADPEDDFIHGNARTRLRDGTVVPVSELKKAYDEAREYRVKQAEFDAQRRDYEAKQAQLAAKEQQSAQIIEQAKQVLAANFPPKPDERLLREGNSIEYMEQKAVYDLAVSKWQGLNAEQQRQAQAAQQRQAEERQTIVAREFELLKEAIPELKTESGFKSFKSTVLDKAPKAYGFTADELANVVDHRVLRVLKDAIAYRDLQAQKPVAIEKAKAAPPVQVQAPGRRVSPQEKAASDRREQLRELQKTGDRRLAESILSSFD